MKTRLLICALLLAALPATAAPRPRVAMLVWQDAGAAWVRRLFQDGALPHVAAMLARGGAVDLLRPPYIHGRAAASAAFWTGTGAEMNGVSGDVVPLPSPNAQVTLDSRDGLRADTLRAEPLDVAVARQGKAVVAIDWPWGQPASAFQDGGVWAAAAPHLTMTGTTTGADPDRLYGTGGFGLPMARGGNGLAEARYVATVVAEIARQRKAIAGAMARPDWDLLTADVAGAGRMAQRWLPITSPTASGYDPELAPRLYPALRTVAQAVDRTVGTMLEALPAGATLVVVSERGPGSQRWEARPDADSGAVHPASPSPDDGRDEDAAGVLFMVGPGVPVRARVPEAYTIDVVPTVSRVLGVDAPKNAVGFPIPGLLPRSAASPRPSSARPGSGSAAKSAPR